MYGNEILIFILFQITLKKLDLTISQLQIDT